MQKSFAQLLTPKMQLCNGCKVKGRQSSRSKKATLKAKLLRFQVFGQPGLVGTDFDSLQFCSPLVCKDVQYLFWKVLIISVGGPKV